MHLTIRKRDLLRGLARTHSVADRKSSMPMLSNVLVSAEANGSLRLSATDLYVGVTIRSNAEVKEPGIVALPARTFFDIVKNLPEGEVTLSVGDQHGCEIRCGKVRFKIPGATGEDFPTLPNPGDAPLAEVPCEILGRLISWTQFSMSTDDTRPHLACGLFEGEGESLRVVTTDGHRLSKAEHRIEGASFDFRMLVPQKGVGELRRLIDDVKGETKGSDEGAPTMSFGHAAGTAFFKKDSHLLTVQLADEQFPPYGRVIPQQHSRRIVVARPALVEALRRISLVASDKSHTVQLQFDPGLLRIQSQNSEVGEGSEELDIDYAGEPLRIGFNARYFVEALSALPHDEVALELSGELDPGVIRPVGDDTNFVGVIMPMRV